LALFVLAGIVGIHASSTIELERLPHVRADAPVCSAGSCCRWPGLSSSPATFRRSSMMFVFAVIAVATARN